MQILLESSTMNIYAFLLAIYTVLSGLYKTTYVVIAA